MQCLNVKNKEVAALLEEYTNILGNENAAYYVLSENNGYGLDKAPNGADSKLFSDLLNHYNGDRNKAILAKSRVYTDSFRNWFGDWTKNVSKVDLLYEYDDLYGKDTIYGRLTTDLLDNFISASSVQNVVRTLIGGNYNAGTKTLTLATDSTTESRNKVNTHELVHVASSLYAFAYEKHKGILKEIYHDYDRINQLLETNNIELTESQIKSFDTLSNIKDKAAKYISDNPSVIEELNKKYPTGNASYFMIEPSKYSLHEFISEAFTNPQLMEVLKNIPYKTNKTNETLFSKFIELVAKIFNLDGNALGRTFEEAHNILSAGAKNKTNVSKVVDENGEPLVVYHHANNEISEFSVEFNNYFSTQKGGTKKALFFTGTRKPKKGTVLDRPFRYPVYLNAKTTIEKTGTKDELRESGEGFVTTINRAAEEVDAAIFYGIDDNQELNQNIYVINNPNNVKSIDNQGAFSTSDNNIYNQINSVNSGSDSTFFNRLFNNKEEQDVNTILSNIESTNSKLKPLTSFLREAITSNDFLKNVKIKYSTTREGLPENVSDSAAYYNTDSNTITVFADSSFKGKGNLADTTILHELIHAASITNLSFNPSKKQEIDFLLDHVRQELSKKYGVSWEELQNINPDTYYGLTNSYEFLSEVFSNSKFINELIRLDSSKNLNNKKSTVIGKIIEWIKSILNINSNDNSYNEAMLQLEDIILNYNDKLEDFNYDLYNQAYNNLSYEYFADNQTTSNPKYIEETFKKQKEHITFESETHTYTNVETGEVYTPVSVVKDANGYGADVTAMSDEDLVYGKQAAAVGTAIHNTIHNILTGDNVQETNEFGIKMSNEAVKMIKEVVIPKLFGNKYTVLASEQIISNDDAKIAGTLDLLMRDNKGKIHLMDIKTKARTFKGKKKYGFDYYFSAKKETKFGGKPDASRHDYQLTMYKRMLEMLGIKVDHKEIIPLEYTLDENGVITEVWVAPLDYAESNGVIYHRTNNALEQEINSNVFVNNISSDIENGELLKQSEIVANILKVLKNQLALYKIKGYTTKSEVLKKYIDELNSLEEKEIIVSYIKKSIDLLKPLIDDYNSNNKLERLGNNNVWNLKTLSAWKNYAESFSNLDDIQDYLFNNSSKFSKKEFEDIQESLAIAINYRNVLENSYKSKGEKIWLDWLLPFSTRVEAEYRDMAEREYKKNNKNTTRLNDVAAMNQYIENYVNSHRNEINNKSRELLRQQSKIATGGTLNSFSRWLDTIFESNDVIVGSMARAYHTRWMQSLDDFNNRYKELLSLTEELENTYPEYKNNPSKLYEFMIETDENGSRLISELSSKFLEDYENIKRTIKADPKYEDSKDRAIAIAAWLEENAPIKGKLKLDKEKLDYIETLFSIGKISLEEKNTLIKNEKRDQSLKKSWAELVSKGKLNEEAADLLRVKFNELNWKYRVPNKDKYKNSKWDSLQNIRESNPNDIRVRYFDFISNLASLGDSYVPTRFKLNGRLPGMSKTTAERLVSGNVTKALWENLKNQFQVRADDTDKGMQMTDELDRPVKFIPIYFTTRVPNEEQSFDIGTIYKEWFRSVNNYQYINSILPQLEYTKWVISNRKTIKTDYKGNPIKNVLSRVMNNGDSDIDPTTNALVTDENLIAQLNTWFDQVIYGEENKDMGTTFGIDNAKALNLFQTYTSLKVMGVNAISMVNNALMAEVQQTIESFAKQYITPESYTRASAEYSRELLDGDILGDIGKRSPKSLVNLLNEHFGIFTDFNEGSLLDNTRVKKLSKLSTLFFTTNIGEHEAQSRFLLASLMDKRALDKDGNDIGSVFDYFSVDDGKLVFDKEHKVANFKRKDQIAFGQQISAIIRKMHGNYANYSKVALQQYGVGKLALAFRKWIWTTAKRRWSKQYYDEFGQTFSKGYYRDGAAFAYNKVMSFFERFVDEAKALEYAEKADWDTMTENEKANVKRFITELSIFSIMSVMSMLISKYEPDDDDEVTKFVLNHLDYQLFRLSTDITFYINPASTMKIIQSPIPSSSVIRSISNFIEACLNPLAEYEKGDRKGELKLKYRFMDLVPITRQIYRLRNIEDEQQLLSIF